MQSFTYGMWVQIPPSPPKTKPLKLLEIPVFSGVFRCFKVHFLSLRDINFSHHFVHFLIKYNTKYNTKIRSSQEYFASIVEKCRSPPKTNIHSR